jgi:glycosyltransferase involved in cell wall biosynthesis
MLPTRPPELTVALLTWNEAARVGACLDSLARQRERDFEVVLVDAASTDATVPIAEARRASFPVPLRIEVAPRRISVGEARNQAVAMARAPNVAFLSADAEAHEDWAAEALHSLRSADLVFGRQLHAPGTGGVAAAVRGLRYHHFPEGPTSDPARFASNVNSAIRREVLLAFPFGAGAAASAVDDMLLTSRALRAGYHAAYNPDMLVRHSDVQSVAAEMRKNLREGLGWGAFAAELGMHRAALSWGALLAFALLLLALSPGLDTLLVLGLCAWVPALRRAWRRRRRMSPRALALGALATPPFDLAFLLAYLRGLATARMAPQRRRREAEEMDA